MLNISESCYFDKLFGTLVKNNILPNKNELISWKYSHNRYYNLLDFDKSVISKVRAEYGKRFENVFLVNSMKSCLIRNYYTPHNNINLKQAAVYFSVLGCILDFIIDYGSDSDKEYALTQLSSSNIKKYFIDFKQSDDNAVDMLFSKIGYSLKSIKDDNKNKYYHILDLINKSTKSEIYSGSADITNDYSKCKDKSIIFAVIPLEISVADINNINNDFFYSIGRVFMLTDDICDLFEDISNNQNNYYYNIFKNKSDIDRNLQSAIEEIMLELNSIKTHSSMLIYDFFRLEIIDWFISCKELGERFSEYNG